MKPPALKPREVIALLERLGFREVRQRGSHRQFRHPDAALRPFPFTRAATSPPPCCARSPKMYTARSTNFWLRESKQPQGLAAAGRCGWHGAHSHGRFLDDVVDGRCCWQEVA